MTTTGNYELLLSIAGEGIMLVHGPEAFDHGDAATLIDALHPARVIVAGVMGRTAAEERGIPFECPGEPPSRILGNLGQENRVFLLNHGKTPESGRIFGEIVAGRIEPTRGLVQVEASSRIVFAWNGCDRQFAEALASILGYGFETVRTHVSIATKRRMIRGCIPGEAVFINGVVIGYAIGDRVVLEEKEGKLEVISGLDVKPHGLEKLAGKGTLDLGTAWCKSGSIRRKNAEIGEQRKNVGRILVIDHAGHELYQYSSEDLCGILAIGDDTTAVCGHICAHLGIPVFGIVDGDSDGIVEPAYAKGSVIVEVIDGRDDDVGVWLALQISNEQYAWDEWVAWALNRLDGKVRVIIEANR
jgi:hypothetical protein